MLAKLLSKIGVPILVKFISGSLGQMPNEVAKRASGALLEVNDAISTNQITEKDVYEANRHIEALENLDEEANINTLKLVHEMMTKEMQAQDKFVRFWRPSFGYSVAIAWLVMMMTISYVVVFDSTNASAVILALVDTTSLWAIALGVLGVSVVKTSKDESLKDKTSFGSKIFNKIL